MDQGAWVLVGALVLATALGGWRWLDDGRFRVRRPATVGDVVTETLRESLGERATLLQFSSSFCAPCRATRRVLGEVERLVPGVRHLEVDVADHLELTRHLDVLRTPTTVVLDAEGREVARAGGALRRDAVLATLARVT